MPVLLPKTFRLGNDNISQDGVCDLHPSTELDNGRYLLEGCCVPGAGAPASIDPEVVDLKLGRFRSATIRPHPSNLFIVRLTPLPPVPAG